MTTSTTTPEHARALALLDRTGNARYEHLAPLDITAWKTTEPRSYAERTKGEELHLKIGDPWGVHLFDCAWFRFRVRIPAGKNGPLALRIDINGELCLVDDAGTPIRGLTCVQSVFDRSLGTPGKTLYRLPESMSRLQEIEIWGDAGYNDLFGSISGDGRIAMAELCSCRDDVRALYYDLEVLSELLTELEEGGFKNNLISALDQADKILATFDPEPVARARELLKPFFLKQEKTSKLNVSAIGHAHLDLAWLWPIRETIRKGGRTFANALYNISQYPEYIFGASQPQLYHWMKSHYPALYRQIKEAVRNGRIEPQGVFWIEPDCNLTSGESLVRQVLLGRKFFAEEFGIVPTYCWQPDVFGYNGQLPQILKKSSVDNFMTIKISWNVVNRFPYHSFVWEGIDGSKINVHMPPEGTYNSPAAPRSLSQINRTYAERDVSNNALICFGIGDGGGGPDAEHLERLRREAHLANLPVTEPRSAAKFFERWSTELDRLPTWKGELYLERHQGTFTTQALTKRFNRKCEVALRELEWASVWAMNYCSVDYPDQELYDIWSKVLLYQFHDILPGSSIKRVYDECNADQQLILEKIEKLIADRYAALSAHVAGESSTVVFNSLPWPRREWHKIEGSWHFVDVPGCGAVPLPKLAHQEFKVTAKAGLLENEHMRVKFSDDGAISSIWNKDLQKELVPAGEAANKFLVYEDLGDAWDFSIDYEKKDMEIYLRQKPDAPRLTNFEASVDGPCAMIEQTFRINTSEIKQRILLHADSPLLEFETKVDWRETKSMLRVRFPVTIKAGEARFEIPFGSIKRSTGNVTSIERAQVEVPALQWIDLAEATHGVALLNDCKHGHRMKGNVIDLNLIRSVPFPAQALIGKGDVSSGGTSYSDQGQHQFRYAFLPHGDSFSAGDATRAARQFNTPLHFASRSQGGTGNLPSSFISIDHPAIEIAALKKSEDGKGFVLRLCHVNDASVKTIVRMDRPRDCFLTNLVEIERSPLAIASNGGIELSFGPFEVKTVLFHL